MESKKTKPKDVDEYISGAPKQAQKKLREIRKCIRSAAPGAVESLKYGLPAFSYKRILVIYAAHTKHIGFYPTPPAIRAFSKELKEYATAKGSIQFPLEKPLPLPLIKKITEFRVKESVEKNGKWRT